MRTFAITTLGCKVNQYESAHFAQALQRLGLVPVSPGERPDLCLVHTCAVTAEAVRKSRQAVRAASADTPADRRSVVVTGCWATAQPRLAGTLPGVRLVIPNARDGEAVDVLTGWVRRQQQHPRRRGSVPGRQTQAAQTTGLGLGGDDGWMSPPLADSVGVGHAQRPATSSPFNIASTGRTVKPNSDAQPPDATTSGSARVGPGWADAPPWPADETGAGSTPAETTPATTPGVPGLLTGFGRHARAFVKVQDGCDAGCTFCIVPSLRRHLHWRPTDEVVAEVRSLVANGLREVVLTGISLGAYGRSTAVRRRHAVGDNGAAGPLAGLVDAVSRVEGLSRLRLSSLAPGDVGEGLLDLMASRANLVPHLHLPLQSGSDAVLRRMNRPYGSDDYQRTIRRVQARLDRPAITTDVIVGFPGETEADFQATLSLARAAGFARVHVFRFSPRPGTAAARWVDRFVPPGVAKERAARLAALASELSLDYRRRFVGENARVIIESPAPRSPTRHRGRTDRYFMVEFAPAPPAGGGGRAAGPESRPLERRVATVRIDRATPSRTIGTLISIDD